MTQHSWLGNYQANTATSDAKKALASIYGTLNQVTDHTTLDWIAYPSYSLKAETDIVGLLSDLADNCKLTYIAVINDHSGVPQDMFHKSVDFFSINDLLAWYAGDQEEPAY